MSIRVRPGYLGRMATSPDRSVRRRRAIRVHEAEVSTDRDSLLGYAEALAMVLAFAALVAAVWIAARPAADADLAIPAAQSQPTSVMAVSNGAVGSTTDVVQPIPSGPQTFEMRGITTGAAAADLGTPTDQVEAIAG